jgi:hypothetical protein
MTPQLYGIGALLLGVAAILSAIFKRQINKALSANSSAHSTPKGAVHL